MKIEKHLSITLTETDWVRVFGAIQCYLIVISKNKDFPNPDAKELMRVRASIVSDLVKAGVMTIQAESDIGKSSLKTK